jgi:hypothetical protein
MAEGSKPRGRPARPARAPAAPKGKPLPAGVTDPNLRKMTVAVLEKLKSPTIPPSVTILEALRQVRDRALAAKVPRSGGTL